MFVTSLNPIFAGRGGALPHTVAMNANTRTAAARAFVRSLNILLKFARMYDFGHPRTKKQYETAWSELQSALGSDNEAGVLLSVSGDQLLLDGMALESAAAEKSFARMLSAAGIASIHFSPQVTQVSLARFVRGFPTGTGAKPAQLVEQLKAALQGDAHIHVNEVCFVPADSAIAKSSVAAHITARTLGMDSAAANELFNDPEKLLQLIVAAEGTKGSGGAGPGGPGRGGGSESGDSGGYGSGGWGDGTGGGDGSNGGNFVSGTAGDAGIGGDVSEAGTWNIVGNSGGGGRLDPNAAGFWLNKDGSSEAKAGSGGGAAGIEGTVPVVGSAAGSSGTGGGGDSGTWNIVGGSGQGTPIDPNAGGFWLNKENPAGSGSGAGSSVRGLAGATPVHGGSGYSAASGDFAGGLSGGNAGGLPGALSSVTGSGNSGSSNSRIWRVPPGASTNADASGPGRWANATSGIRVGRSSRAAAGPGTMSVETGLMTLQEDELQGILQVLAQIARTGDGTKDKLDPNAFQSRLSTLPRRARFTISQALSALAAQAPTESSDRPTLLKLAEHIAIRFALESYERGDIEVNSVRQVLDEMNTELDGLRKIMGVYEEKMARAGIEVESHVELLAQQFWSEVDEDKKKAVLESGDAWCVPAAKVREYVEALQARGESETAIVILRNYASCITNKANQPRRQAAMGLAELAALYANTDECLLMDVIRQIGVQLPEERDSEMQSLVRRRFRAHVAGGHEETILRSDSTFC